MRNVFKVSAGTTIALVLALTIFRQWRANLYAGLTPTQIADIETSNMAALTAGIVLVLVLVLVIWGIKRTPARTDNTPDNYRHIETEWRELADPRPPQPQLPQPHYVNVPRYSAFGTSQPIGAQPETIVTTSTDDQADAPQLEVPLKYLYRFAALDGPTRESWVGKTTAYTQARRFFALHGFLDSAGKWRAEYPPPSRREWLEQFDQDTHRSQ